jgi:hypothetical protein
MHALSVIVRQVVISFTDMLLYFVVVGRRFVTFLKCCMPMYHLTVIPRPTRYLVPTDTRFPFSCFIFYINRPRLEIANRC